MTLYPKISVVIPVRNEARFIAQTVERILTQDYPSDKIEILVAAGNSSDNTTPIVTAIAARDGRVKVFPNLVGLSSGGRNVGIKNSTGEIIIFVDGHTYIDNDLLLKNTVSLMAEKEVAILSRPQFLEPPDNTLFQQAVALARRSLIGHGLDSTIYTDKDQYVDPTSSGASYRREIFEKIGYYDERFDACEDVELNFRLAQAGYRSFTSMKLAVYYYPRETLGGLFRQLARYGTGRFRLARKHPQSLSLSTLLPALFTVGIPLLAIAGIFMKPLFYLFGMVLALYLLTISLSSVAVGLRQGLRFLPWLPVIYPAIHFGLGWGFLSELARTLVGKGFSFRKNQKDN